MGVPLEQLFRAATLTNAQAFKIDNDYGSIEPGKVANLLMLKSNTLKQVEAYNQIEYVIKSGISIEHRKLATQFTCAANK